MATLNGFTNLESIKRSLAHLYAIYSPVHIHSFATDFIAARDNKRYNGDATIATQRLAADIAAHYRLPITTVIVNYSSTMQPPGRVELSAGNEFIVDLQAKYRTKLNTIAGILAHEVAHIFLHRCGAELKDNHENEILTDTTASFLGFGITILNAAYSHTDYFPKLTQTTRQYFGYLSLDEFGYILARRDHAFGLKSRSYIRRQECKDAYDTGMQKYTSELKARPFSPRPWYQRLTHHYLNKTAKGSLPPIHFECPKCCKTLRIPAAQQKLSVHCPICDSRFFCYS